MDPDDEDNPRRGGNGWLGIFLGGAPLTSQYLLDPTEEHYKCALQVRNPKALLSIESDLRKASNDLSSLKFNGKLRLPASSSPPTEFDKEEFLLTVDYSVNAYGFQTFFHLPDETGEMRDLSEDSHLFTVQQVIDEHYSRLDEPGPVYDPGTTTETDASKLARFRCYDKYERFDMSLCRRVMDSLLTHNLKATIRIKFGHLPQFKALPGQIIVMMALDVSNASATQDIDDATTSFKALTLDNFPGQNIVEFTTEAQRLIKIMQTGYALPYKTGSMLLSKVENTGSKYFNQQIHIFQSHVKLMERSVGPLKDPKSMTRHPDYSTYGPLGLCALLQEEYGELKRNAEWPALNDTIPEGNNASVRNPNGRRCFNCNSPFHMANDPECPENQDNLTNLHRNRIEMESTHKDLRHQILILLGTTIPLHPVHVLIVILMIPIPLILGPDLHRLQHQYGSIFIPKIRIKRSLSTGRNTTFVPNACVVLLRKLDTTILLTRQHNMLLE